MSAQLGKCAQATRILLILLNILFLLLGIGLIAGGSVLVATGRTFEVLFNGTFSAVGISVLIIIAGIVTFIISALAILGGIFKSRILLGIYLIAVLLIILVEVVVAVVSIIKRGELDGAVENTVKRLINEYDENEGVKDTIDFFQDRFSCCGWHNYTDYNRTMGPLPQSCNCTDTGTACVDVDGQQVWRAGCRGSLLSVSNGVVIGVIVLAILFVVVELFALLCGCGLCICIHRGIDENKYTKV